MAIVARKRKTGTVYWIAFSWQGKRVWERAGSDRREAERLEKRRKAEVAKGVYSPDQERKATSFGQWARHWMDERKARTADDERRWLSHYVLTRDWLEPMPLADLRPMHIARLVKELGEAKGVKTGRKLSAKSIANIYGAVRTMLRDARIQELLPSDPCVLPRGTIKRRVTTRRLPYEAHEGAKLTTDERIAPAFRVWIALAFYTGMRQGEVCGRRWCDYDRSPRPLGSLTVETQYNGEPLKTSSEGDSRPRVIPVHPELARILDWWWREGFELVFASKPKLDDFIVPARDGEGAHTKSSSYKAWRRACDLVGVENRSLHSTRHTFVSLARRNGARKEVIERVTHNSSGDIVDAYTYWDWAPLCEAVLCFLLVDANVDTIADRAGNMVEAPGIEAGAQGQTAHDSAGLDESDDDAEPPKRAESDRASADCDASQQKAFGAIAKLFEVERALRPLAKAAAVRFAKAGGVS